MDEYGSQTAHPAVERHDDALLRRNVFELHRVDIRPVRGNTLEGPASEPGFLLIIEVRGAELLRQEAANSAIVSYAESMQPASNAVETPLFGASDSPLKR